MRIIKMFGQERKYLLEDGRIIDIADYDKAIKQPVKIPEKVILEPIKKAKKKRTRKKKEVN